MKSAICLLIGCLISMMAVGQTLNELFLATAEDDVEKMLRGIAIHGINAKDDMGNTPLILTAFEGSQKCFVALMARKADIHAKNQLGDDAVKIAALKGEKAMVETLIKAGGNINPKGWSPLIYAATNGHTEIVEMLILKGVDIDMMSPNGTTALMMAAREGHYETVKMLVWHGAYVDKKNESGMTARKYAIQGKHSDIADLLKKAGATE